MPPVRVTSFQYLPPQLRAQEVALAKASLGLQGADTAPAPMGGDITMVARRFTFGLTDSFLANGTITEIESLAQNLNGAAGNPSSSGLSLLSISISKAAESLARGLVDGAGESINNARGFQSILDGSNSIAVRASSTPTLPVRVLSTIRLAALLPDLAAV